MQIEVWEDRDVGQSFSMSCKHDGPGVANSKPRMPGMRNRDVRDGQRGVWDVPDARWPGRRRRRRGKVHRDVLLVELRMGALVLFERSLGGSGDLDVREFGQYCASRAGYLESKWYSIFIPRRYDDPPPTHPTKDTSWDQTSLHNGATAGYRQVR